MTNDKSAFTFFSMIKKGNLLRADRPLEPNRQPPFVPWGSNLIPHYLSTCGEPQSSNHGNLVRSQNLSAVNQTLEPNSKLTEETPNSTPDVAQELSESLVRDSTENEPRKVIENIDSELLSEVTDFNSCWVRWKGFIKTLKRKVSENSSGSQGKLSTFKDSFYSKALLYALTMNEQSQRDIRQHGAAAFSQFLNHNKSLFDAFSSSSMLDRKQVYQFLQNILVCLCVYEVLEEHSNVLKLEGASAAGLCPDKKEFISKHVKQSWNELFLDENEEIAGFVNFLTKEIPSDLIESVKYNREQLLVKFNLKLHSRENRFIIQGSTDRLDDLQVSKLN